MITASTSNITAVATSIRPYFYAHIGTVIVAIVCDQYWQTMSIMIIVLYLCGAI